MYLYKHMQIILLLCVYIHEFQIMYRFLHNSMYNVEKTKVECLVNQLVISLLFIIFLYIYIYIYIYIIYIYNVCVCN